MWKFAIVFIIFQLTFFVNSDAGSDPKCTAWIKEMRKKQMCYNISLPIDEKVVETISKLNSTYCETQEKIAELLNLKNADKNAYKNYLTKAVKDSDLQPIFLKNIDFCADLVPKLVPSFAKKINITEEGCGAKLMLTVNCWMISAFLECPAKYSTDSSECKELTKTLKECQENAADIIEGFESLR